MHAVCTKRHWRPPIIIDLKARGIPDSEPFTGGARPSMSDADEYSSDDDGHIHDDFEPQVDPTLSVDVGSGLSVRPEDCLFRPLRDQRLSRPPRSPTSFPALDLPRLPRPNLAEP